MLVRCKASQRKHFPPTEWKEIVGKTGTLFEASFDAEKLEQHGLTLYWTHDNWRMAKIHADEGWNQIGVGKDGTYYATVLLGSA